MFKLYQCYAYSSKVLHKPWFERACITGPLKTMLERKYCSYRAISHFSTVFSNRFEENSSISIKFEIVVCKLFQFRTVYILSFGKGLEEIVILLLASMYIFCGECRARSACTLLIAGNFLCAIVH